jgi:hypothetical protein
LEDASSKLYLAEARGMRAFYNMLLLDLFGLTLSKEDLGAVSTILRGDQAIEYIKKELLDIEPVLETSTGPGRLTKAGVWGLLAKLHLNASVWRDIYVAKHTFKAEDMDKVLEYTDKIIKSGK